ncbi:hypothetical protein FOZ62_013685, partial [Perkinsus olseni]
RVVVTGLSPDIMKLSSSSSSNNEGRVVADPYGLTLSVHTHYDYQSTTHSHTEHHRTDNSKYKSTNKDDYQKATSSSSAIEGGQGALDNNNNNTDVMIMLGSSMGRKWRMVQNKLDEATTNASMRETEYEERIAELECDVASRDHQILILKLTIRDLMQQADNMNDDGGTTLPMERSISLGEQLENNSNEGRLQNTMKHLRTKMNNIQRQNDRLKRKNKELKAELVRVNDE